MWGTMEDNDIKIQAGTLSSYTYIHYGHKFMVQNDPYEAMTHMGNGYILFIYMT